MVLFSLFIIMFIMIYQSIFVIVNIQIVMFLLFFFVISAEYKCWLYSFLLCRNMALRVQTSRLMFSNSQAFTAF